MSDSTIITANGFPDPESLALVSDVQFREPYSSAAINRKLRGLALPGIYSGFSPSPGAGLNLLISSGNDSGTCSFNIGTAYQLSAHQQADVSMPMTAGKAVLVALQVTYALGTETDQVNSASTVKAVEFVMLDVKATLAENQLEMCKVTIPADATQITSDMIDLSGRLMRSLTFELSSAIDSSNEEVAANSLAVKNAILHIEKEIAEAISTKNLTVSGAVSLLSTLNVTAAATFGSDVTLKGNLLADRVRAASGIDIGYQSTSANTRQLNFYSNSDNTLTGYINVVGPSQAGSYMTLKAGVLTLSGSTSVTGALSVGSSVTVSGSVGLASDLTVSGSSILNGSLTVSGATTLNGGLVMKGPLKSYGEVSLLQGGNALRLSNGSISVIHRTDNNGYYILLTNSGDPTGDYNNLRPLSISLTTGSVTISQSLGVNSTLAVTGATSLGSSLTVNGSTALSGALTVSGIAFFVSALRANQYIDIGFGNPVAGNRQLSFYSGGNTSSGSYISVSGASSENMFINSANIQLGGDIYTYSTNAYRIISGNYGAFLRFDGSEFYLMLTNAGDQRGGWNGLRPFYFNAASGNVTMGHNVQINGGLNVAGRISSNADLLAGAVVYSGNGASFLAQDGNVYGSVWGGYLNNWINGRINASSVSDIRLGGQGAAVMAQALTVPGGCVMTGWATEGSTPSGDTIYYRPIQKAVAGVWYTIGQI